MIYIPLYIGLLFLRYGTSGTKMQTPTLRNETGQHKKCAKIITKFYIKHCSKLENVGLPILRTTVS